MKDKKVLIIGVIITVILVFTVGVTYAFYSYNRTGTNNSQLVVGDIYMHFNESNELTITNAMPQSTYDTNNYFEFTIDGKNTYTEEDIWYEIVLSHGDADATRTERLRDDLLRFRLVEVINGEEEELVTNQSYDDLTNQRIWVDTISRNTTSEVVHTYRLYMWVTNTISIGNTSGADYDTETWNNEVYASIKVNVNGDFNEKDLPFFNDFKKTVIANNTDTCPTYVEEDGITYISGTKSCIDFNYVWYSGKLWRITAIYPDGTMKMITDDNITTIRYGSDVNFYTDANNSSYMYQWLNEDFLSTLYNYENIIVTDASWNATNSNGAGASTKLPETTMVTAPVGLLNRYEYYKSYQNISYSNGYLNIGYYWWLLTPYTSSTALAAGYSDIAIDFPWSGSYGVRPSVNLQSGITINSGSGTISDPYTINGDKDMAIANTTLLNTRTSGEYVNFDGELYRIVGIENNITKLNKMDYVRDENDTLIDKNFSSSVTYGSGDSDTYWDYYLNDSWYNSISQNYKNMIVEGTYYLGTTSSNYKGAICATASNTITTSDCEKTSNIWTGYVGLPRYGEMFASQQGSGYSSSSSIWLITSHSSSRVWHISQTNGSNQFDPSLSFYATSARPSINLSSAVKITGGTGLKNDPFEISL